MSYIIKQKIRGKVYAYEVTSYWDSEKKQARQKRNYLGVWDEETQSILPKVCERDIRTTKVFGTPYLLNELCKEKELEKKLKEAFGKDGNKILSLAISRVIEPASLKNIHHIFDEHFLTEMFNLAEDEDFTSQWLSEFLEKLGTEEKKTNTFFQSLIEPLKGKDTIAYDITSLSSNSRLLEWLEYGYNRDGVDLPQVNLGLVLSLESQIPLYFKLFPGSITDVVTLKNLISDIQALGIKKCTIILDRGFYSESNVSELHANNIDFIMPLPFNNKEGKELISHTNTGIENPANVRRYAGEIYYVLEEKIQIGDVACFSYILYNKERESLELKSFFNRMIDIESKLEGKRVYANGYEHFKQVAGDFARYFECSVSNNKIRLKRRSNAISQTTNRFGKTILISSTKKNWDEVLSLYRQKDSIENEFDVLKNELNAMPLRVRKLETLKGLLFVFFVALIIRAYLVRRAREAKLLDRNSIEDIIRDLNKFRAVHTGGIWKLTELTKAGRTIFEKMEIQIPLDPNLVIKKTGV